MNTVSVMDRQQQFLIYLQQPELCELFYEFMKEERLEYILEFYLACDELTKLNSQRKKPDQIIALIYKHYLLSHKSFLPTNLMNSIEERLKSRHFTCTFYEQAHAYALKYMLQMCFPKFLIEQENQRREKSIKQDTSTIYYPMHRRPIKSKKIAVNAKSNLKLSLDNVKQYAKTLTSGSADSSAVLDQQIAKTIDNTDQCLIETSSTNRTLRTNPIPINTHVLKSQSSSSSLIEVIWCPSLDSSKTLLSTISDKSSGSLTFGRFRRLFRKSRSYRYFFKCTCEPEINNNRYIFRELMHDDEIVPMFNGKIFLQLDGTD